MPATLRQLPNLPLCFSSPASVLYEGRQQLQQHRLQARGHRLQQHLTPISPAAAAQSASSSHAAGDASAEDTSADLDMPAGGLVPSSRRPGGLGVSRGQRQVHGSSEETAKLPASRLNLRLTMQRNSSTGAQRGMLAAPPLQALKWARDAATAAMAGELLSAQQEQQLGARVQQLVRLEGLRAGLTREQGKLPRAQEWAEAAGMTIRQLEDAQASGVQARELLVNCNMRLVASLAQRYQGRDLQLEDLVSEGRLGLRLAVGKFDPSRGHRFSTHAHWWIRQALVRAVESQGRTVRLPKSQQSAARKVWRAEESLALKLGRQPSEGEVAACCGIAPAQLGHLRKRFRHPITASGLVFGQLSPADAWQRELIDDVAQDPFSIACSALLEASLASLLLTLPEREQRLLCLRYGLDGGREQTHRDIGKALGVSPARVGQLEARAIRKLQGRFWELI